MHDHQGHAVGNIRGGISILVPTALFASIARRIVELLGGRIWVEDNPEDGSVFLSTLHKAAEPV